MNGCTSRPVIYKTKQNKNKAWYLNRSLLVLDEGRLVHFETYLTKNSYKAFVIATLHPFFNAGKSKILLKVKYH